MFLNNSKCMAVRLIDTLIFKRMSLCQGMCSKTLREMEKMAPVPYTIAIGSLMYIIMHIQPDICYAARLVSRFQANPILAHQKVVKRILMHLKKTIYYILYCQDFDWYLRGQCNTKQSSDLDQYKFTTRYALLLNNGTMVYSSKKQASVALSIMEMEYIG